MSKIYNDDGTYTDEFNEFLEDWLDPVMEATIAQIAKWLRSHNAPIGDFKLLELVIHEATELHSDILWLDAYGEGEFKRVSRDLNKSTQPEEE